jgi:hypothetical protein
VSAAEPQAAAATRRDWLLAAPFGLLILLFVAPWPRPSVALRDACPLQDAGRFAVQCDLDAATARSGRAWLRKSLRVYEDGLLLRSADHAGDVRRENPGSYHTNGRTLTLASLDRSDPRSNGRAYLLRPAEHDPLGLSREARRAAILLLLAAFGVLCLLRRSAGLALAGAILTSLAGVAVQVVCVLQAAPVHVDAGYWLPAAEAAARGTRPYTGLAFLYTPVGLYQFALWGRLWPSGAPPYAWYLALVVLYEIACAAMLHLILARAGVPRLLAALSALGLFSLTLWFDGGRILFEPLYLFLILAACFLVLRSTMPASRLAAGALAALAFFIKQYGGVGIWGLCGFGLAEPREFRARVKQLFWIGAGFAAGLFLLSLGLIALGVDLKALVAQSGGQSYPRRYEATWLWFFLRQCTIVLPALLTPFLPGAWSRPAVRAGVCFGLAGCMPFFFRQHQYYFLIPTPWLFLLFALGIDQLAALRPRLRAPFHGVAALLLVAMPLRGAFAQGAWFVSEPRGDQLRRARLMTDAWPAERRTLLFGFPGMYAATRYRSPDERVLGYRFLNEASAEQLLAGFARAEGVWIDPAGMYARGADSTLRQAGSSLEDQLQKYGFTQKLVLEERFELWTKGP